MANYTLTIVLENASLMTAYGMMLNGAVFIPGNTTQEVGAGSTLAFSPDYGNVYLNGTDMGDSYTYTINSDVTVTCSNDYNVYIVAEESSESGGSGGGHKALIDGTAYGISGGRSMAGGTVYDIAKGKAMVNGTVYEITFAGMDDDNCIVTITGTGAVGSTYVQIDNTVYTEAGMVEVPVGTTINCNAHNPNGGTIGRNIIYVNGTIVATKAGLLAYNYTVSGNVTIELKHNSAKYNGSSIYITEE